MTSAASAIHSWHPRDENDSGSGIECVAWFDAHSPSNYVLSSGKVVDIYDKISGAVGLTQATAGDRYTWSATGLNGRPAFVSTTGNNMSGSLAAILNAYQNHSANTFIYLASHDMASNETLFEVRNTGFNSGCSYGYFSSVGTGVYYAQRRGDVTFFGTRFESDDVDGDPHEHAWTYDGAGFAVSDGSVSGASVRHHYDGSASVDSVLGGDLNYDRDNLTVNEYRTWTFNGAWASMIIYAGVLANDGIARAYKFLRHRQGL